MAITSDDLRKLSDAVGVKPTPIAGRVGFGGFALPATAAEIATAEASLSELSPDQKNRLAVRAFNDVSGGADPDWLLWNAEMRQRFEDSLRTGFGDLSVEDGIRCVLAIRKNRSLYEAKGIELPRSTRRTPSIDFLAGELTVAEMAVGRLQRKYGFSVGEMLVDGDASEAVCRLAVSAFPETTYERVRRGVLHLRKKGIGRRVESHPSVEWSDGFPLTAVEPSDGAKVSRLSHEGKEVFVGQAWASSSVEETLIALLESEVLQRISPIFWHPKSDDIWVRTALSGEGSTVAVRLRNGVVESLKPFLNPRYVAA